VSSTRDHRGETTERVPYHYVPLNSWHKEKY
jgi:hypothetical protein